MPTSVTHTNRQAPIASSAGTEWESCLRELEKAKAELARRSIAFSFHSGRAPAIATFARQAWMQMTVGRPSAKSPGSVLYFVLVERVSR